MCRNYNNVKYGASVRVDLYLGKIRQTPPDTGRRRCRLRSSFARHIPHIPHYMYTAVKIIITFIPPPVGEIILEDRSHVQDINHVSKTVVGDVCVRIYMYIVYVYEVISPSDILCYISIYYKGVCVYLCPVHALSAHVMTTTGCEVHWNGKLCAAAAGICFTFRCTLCMTCNIK